MLLFVTAGMCNGAHSLSHEEAAVLDTFFRSLIERSEVGYVFLGEKPICSHGYTIKDEIFPDAPRHVDSVALREGARVWNNQTGLFSKNSNIIAKFEDESSINNATYNNGWYEVLFINKDLFLNTVKENLALFKYVLGPTTTPEGLLAALMEKNQNLDTVLKHDRVLTGIVLGFGTENSLYGARWENVGDALLYVSDQPPYRCKSQDLPDELQEHNDLGLYSVEDYKTFLKPKDLLPSFGFSSLEEEHRALEDAFTISSPALENDPPFIFATLKNLPENKRLIKKLEATQEKIKGLLASQTFLQDVMKEMIGETIEVTSPIRCHLSMDGYTEDQIASIVAKDILNNMLSDQEEYVGNFLKGFHGKERIEISCSTPFFPNYKSQLSLARDNVRRADDFFAQASQEEKFAEVIPKKVLFKVLKEGDGARMDNQAQVLVEYRICDPNDQCIAESKDPVSIDLRQTIPGFREGIKGMRINETREILIHPSLAYGVHTFLEKGIYLKVNVTLRGFQPSICLNETKVKDIQLSFLFDPKFESLCSKNLESMARFQGGRMANYFSRSPLVNIKKVYSLLKLMIEQQVAPSNLSQAELEVVNKIHWNIYFSARHS